MRRVHGFTLVELLVCIVIIGFLAALVLPTYQRSIERTNTSKCAATLRTLSIALLNAAADSNNQIPRSSHSAFAHRERGWSRTILPYLGEKDNPTVSEWAQIRERRFKCPTDANGPGGQSYGLNVFFELDPGFDEYEGAPEQWRTLHAVPHPSKTILLAETQGNTDHVMSHFWTGEGEVGYDCAHDRHEGKSNYAFADGHIQLLGLRDVYAPSADINRWNPALAGR